MLVDLDGRSEIDGLSDKLGEADVEGRVLGKFDGCDVGQSETEGLSDGLELGWLLGLSVTITTVGVPNVTASTAIDGKSSMPSFSATVFITSAIS